MSSHEGMSDNEKLTGSPYAGVAIGAVIGMVLAIVISLFTEFPMMVLVIFGLALGAGVGVALSGTSFSKNDGTGDENSTR